MLFRVQNLIQLVLNRELYESRNNRKKWTKIIHILYVNIR